MDGLVLLTSALAATSVVCLSLGLGMLATRDRSRLSERLQRSGRVSQRSRATADVTWRERPRRLLTALDKPLEGMSWSDAARTQLRQAEIHLHLSEYLALRFGVALLAATLIVLIGGNLLAAIIAVGVGGSLWWLPNYFVRRRVARRQSLLESQLDGALLSVASSLRSGFSFLQSCQMAAEQLRWPLKNEIEEMLQEVSLGASIEDALANLAERTSSYELDLTVNAVMVNRSVGGNLAEILESVAKTIRERRELRGHVMALTAQQRLSAVFVSAVPVFMSGFLSLTAWEFMKPLWLTTTGHVLIAIGLGLDLLGFLVMRRLTRIDF